MLVHGVLELGEGPRADTGHPGQPALTQRDEVFQGFHPRVGE